MRDLLCHPASRLAGTLLVLAGAAYPLAVSVRPPSSVSAGSGGGPGTSVVAAAQEGDPGPGRFSLDVDRSASDVGVVSAPGVPRTFYFTRAIYSGRRDFWAGSSWRIDYPKADHQFVFGLRRLTEIDAYEGDNAIRLTDPELSRFPFLYMLEVGHMRLTEEEVEGLRRYLQAGGFLFVDDFWGTWEWRNWESEIARVLPGRSIRDLPMDHPVFHQFYDIEEVVQVPSVRIVSGGPTWEKDGIVPYVRGIFDEQGRLMVLINWNTDLGDAWEWVDNPYYPLRYSNYAYQLAINAILYAMSH